MMRKIIKTENIKPFAPHEWAIDAGGALYSVHVPIRPDGTIESGSAETQAEVTFSDLEVTLKEAGADFSDVVLVQIFLSSLEHKPSVDKVYLRYFTEPYPVRACIAVSELPTPGTVIEVIATTAVGE
jgi:2-iminobutanoate/2-iminopropanoate deaminase